MALLNIVKEGDPVLRGVCREVTEITPRIITLLDDMRETLAKAEGVGLAAPQVGVRRRIVLVEHDKAGVLEMINPVILETSGSQTGSEGCLSLPGKAGQVTRPNYVKAKALDENMEEYIIEGEELLARAICHELDHLEGHMYVEKVEGQLEDVTYDEE